MESLSLLVPPGAPGLSSLQVLTVDLSETSCVHLGRRKTTGTALIILVGNSPGLQRCPLMYLSTVSLWFIFVRYRRTVSLLSELGSPARELDQPEPSGSRNGPPDPRTRCYPPTWNEKVQWQLQPQSHGSSEQRGQKGCGYY